MSDTFHTGGSPIQGHQAAAFNPSEQIQDLRDSHEGLHEMVLKHGAVIAEHQGNLKGVFPAVSAVQSSLGAWLTVVAIVAAILAGLGWFNLNRSASVGDRVDTLSTSMNTRLGGLETRTGAMEAKLTILPQQVAEELRRQQQTAAQGQKKP